MISKWLVGAVINIIGSITINFGTNLVRLAHCQQEKLAQEGWVRPLYKSKIWLAGIGSFSLGNIANFISFGFAAQSLLAALSSVQFVSNVVFSAYLCKERVTNRVIISTAWIIAGNCVIVIFSDPSTNDFSAQELWGLYSRHDFVAYLSFLFVSVVILQVTYIRLDHEKRVSMESGRSMGRQESLIPIIYALISGIIGTQAVTLAKSASILLRTTIVDSNQMADPAIYFVLIMWLMTMSFWLFRMNKALQMFDSLLIIPVLQVVWIVFSVIGGGIYFREFDEFTFGAMCGFFMGILMIVLGVNILSSRAGKTSSLLGCLPSHSVTDFYSDAGSSGVSRRNSLISLLAPETLLSPRFDIPPANRSASP